MPAVSSTSAVPAVATSLKPMSTNLRATGATCRLSWSVTLMKMAPCVGSFWPAASCAFAKVVGDTHDFARRLHLRTEHGIDAGELTPREYGRLYVVVASGIEVGAALDKLWQEFAQLAARHQARRYLCHRNPRSF